MLQKSLLNIAISENVTKKFVNSFNITISENVTKKSANGFNIAILENVKKKSILTMYKIQKIYEKVYQ